MPTLQSLGIPTSNATSLPTTGLPRPRRQAARPPAPAPALPSIPTGGARSASLVDFVRQDARNALAPAAAPAPAAAGPQYPTLQLPGLAADSGNPYDSAFQASLKTARSGVESQLRNALGEVARQEAVQQQMVGQLPGQLSGIYNQAVGQSKQFAKDADAAQAAIGPAPGQAGEGAIAPLLAAMSMAHGTQQAGVPTLRLAVSDAAARQRGALQQMRDSALADLAGEERQALTSRQARSNDDAFRLAEMQNRDSLARFELEMGERRRQEDIALDDRRRAEDFEQQVALRGLGEQPAAGRRFGAREISAERGAALRDAARYRRNSAYRKIMDKLRGKAPEEVASVVAAFEKKNKKADTRALSVALFDLYGQPQAK